MSGWANTYSKPAMDYASITKRNELVDLVRLNPSVRSCVQRIVCEVVPVELNIMEQNKPLKPDLNAIVGPYFAAFLSESIEMAYMCGFVVFVLKKYQGIQMPHLLPLGSFTWSVQVCTPETKKRKREEECLFRYDVQPIHPNVSVDDLYVYNFQTPRVQHEQCLPSPLDSLLGSIRNIKEMQLKIEQVVKWNSIKHITTSERVDIPKDQTTDGLSLLDDFRHYCVGNTPSTGLSKQYMMINGPRGVAARNDPSVTRDNWIKRFSFNEAIEEPTAKIHMLPPNTDVQELGTLDMNINLQELQQLFHNEVHEFFHFTTGSDLGNTKNQAMYVSQTEIKSMKQMSNFAKRVVTYAYACAFDVAEKTVRVELPQPSGMHIQSADDIKKLSEAGTLLPGDSLKLRKGLMRNA